MPASLRQAFRNLRRRPLLTSIVVLTFAVGIGATSAIYSVVEGVLLRPLPYPEPERLVVVWRDLVQRDARNYSATPADLADYAETGSLADVAGVVTREHSLFPESGEGASRAERITAAWCTWNLPAVLGVEPFLGRSFVAEDGYPGGPRPAEAGGQGPEAKAGAGTDAEDGAAGLVPSVLLSHRLWQRRYGGAPDVVGRTIYVDGAPALVVGVMPPGFQVWLRPEAGVSSDVDLWGALRLDLPSEPRQAWYLDTVARLAPDATLQQARAELDAVAARQREAFALYEEADLRVRVEPMREDLTEEMAPVLRTLFWATAAVLLIACVNVAGLLLARAAGRNRELAVRAALGARRRDLFLPSLVESGLLALAGGALGLLLARLSLGALLALAPPELPRLAGIGLNSSVVAFTLGASVLAAVLAGLLPALRRVAAARSGAAGAPTEALRGAIGSGGTRAGGLGGLGRLRQGLVVVEVALSLLLLIGAGLALRSFTVLTATDPGFEPGGALTFRAPLPLGVYATPEARATYKRQLAERLRALPGVEAVGAASTLPLAGSGARGPYLTTEAAARGDGKDFRQAHYRSVLPGYFEAVGTPLLAGRDFEAGDDGGPPRVIVDDLLARRNWPDESALGKRLQVRLPPVEAEVIGVVAHQRPEGLAEEGQETIYFHDGAAGSAPDLAWVVRTEGDPASLIPSLRDVLDELDRQVPLTRPELLVERVREARAPARFSLVLVGIFGIVAVILALVGLYGSLSQLVTERRAEMGLRMALGATPRRILGGVVRRGLMLVLVGLAAGILLALVAGRLLASLLAGIEPTDPLTYLLTSALFLLVALGATLLPALRAGRTDPLTALRTDG